MDAHQLMKEGYYNIYGCAGARRKCPAEYMEYANKIDSMSGDIYRHLNFDRLPEYTEQAGKTNVAQLTWCLSCCK